MKVVIIDNMEKCKEVINQLQEKEYKLYCFQYTYYHPEGFHAWFMDKAGNRVEFVTKIMKVQEALIGYNSDK